jgi:hypothetical protein
MDVIQLILVEPDTRRLGWGVAKFVGFLQVREVSVFINLLYIDIRMDYKITIFTHMQDNSSNITCLPRENVLFKSKMNPSPP